jgi:hypothetical protein
VTPPPPVARPAPIVKPAPVVKPVPEKREIATIAPAAGAAGPPKLDPKIVEQIFSCLAPGLPSDWKKTWVVVTHSEPVATSKFYFTTSYRDEDAEELVPCNAQEITRRITSLTAALPVDQQRWTTARLSIDSEGAFALNYAYAK